MPDPTPTTPGPLSSLQDLMAESYWPDDYLAEATPILAEWLTRPLGPADLDAVKRCFTVLDALDVTDNAPYAILWALRATAAIPAMAELDNHLTTWREWIEAEYFDGEPLDLPPWPAVDHA